MRDAADDASWATPFPLRKVGAHWKSIVHRAMREFLRDDIPTVAAGATFYILLAFFPAVAAFVSLYGLFADIAVASKHLSYLQGFLPDDVLRFIGTEMIRVTTSHPSRLSFAFVVSLLLSLWSANAGVKAVVTGLNTAYEQNERRSFFGLYLLTLAMTIAAIAMAMAAITIIVAIPITQQFLGFSDYDILEFLRWPLLLLGSIATLAFVYRYGPSRRRGRRRHVLLGSVVASGAWLLVSLAFSWYVADFAHFDQTYGSLGALIGFMTWIWLGLIVVLFGAELNAEVERLH